jgi:ribulose 1,5-bisphosphate carboxylase large subunit-like protein
MDPERIYATYLLESPLAIEQAAAKLAGEQSTGTFVSLPRETAALKERFGSRLESIVPLAPVHEPSLPYRPALQERHAGRPHQRAHVTVSIPLEVTGLELTSVLACVAGNVFELGEASGIRLVDLALPPAFGRAHPGPQFGIGGTRALVGRADGPIIGSIIKPSVGLSPGQTAEVVRELAEAGVDFVKDDELMTDPPYAPLEQRVRAVLAVLAAYAGRSGKRVMYAANISSDDPEKMLRQHDLVADLGGTCVMVSVNQVGLAGLGFLRRRSRLPIHAHRNGWGALTRAPLLGMEFGVYQTFWRLGGVDQLHVNGFGNKFWEPDESVARSIRACLTPLFRDDDRLLPVISSGQWGGQAPATYGAVGSADVMYLAGGGIQGHPGGAAAGVRAVRQAWEAALAGVALDAHAARHEELAQALAAFGRRDS